ncbi:hypothetical protein GCM10022252_72530 [Streptosporangium oxazolinicum]|uniref:Uncharacterized protein n=1 Tax=Streptosporangium oxazolinicum TaxID=909287 RepID=A0ABP8BJJ3_9ACTN
MIGSILIALGCLLAPFALTAYWAANEIADPNRYIRNVTPLSAHPAVRNAVTDRVTDEIMVRLRGLGISVGGEIIRETVKNGVDEDFAVAWVEINRLTHRRLLAVLGHTPNLSVQGEGVGYDLAPVYELVKRRLQVAGLGAASHLPKTHPVTLLLPKSAIVMIDGIYDKLISLRWVLIILSPALIAAGVFLIRDRCAALIGAGLGLAASMLALAIAMSAIRNVYLPDSVTGLSYAAVVAIFDALTAFLRDSLRVLFALGLIVAAAAFVVRGRRIRSRLAAAAFEAGPHQSAEPPKDVPEG